LEDGRTDDQRVTATAVYSRNASGAAGGLGTDFSRARQVEILKLFPSLLRSLPSAGKTGAVCA